MGSHFQAGAAADSKTSNLAKAQRELEEMYMGVPDESVNLTFQHLANIKQNHVVTDQPVISHVPASAACGQKPDMISASNTLSKLPSLDFNRGMQASRPNQYHHQTGHISTSASTYHNSPALPPVSSVMKIATRNDMYRHGGATFYENNDDDDMMTMAQQNKGTDDNKIKHYSVMRSPVNSPRGVVAGRQGIPHSKICAICNRHIYVFRHRCLVCGRVYCRNCVNIGMGEMSEGRKCVDCLGRRFSQRYIQRAGKTDKQWWRFCCCHKSYPDKVKHQELKWAEKGPKVTSRMTQINNDGRSRSSIITMQLQQQQQRHSSYDHDNYPPSFVSTTPRSPAVSSPYLHF